MNRPNHVDNPVDGNEYWCIIQPQFNDKTYLVSLPWKGRYQEGILYKNDNDLISIKSNNYNLFDTEEDAKTAIEYDWNSPPESIKNDLVLSEEVLYKVQDSFNHPKENDSTPNLMTITFDIATQQQLLMALALSMNMQLAPRMEVDMPPREIK